MKELIEIQRKLKAPKSQFNAFANYKFRSAEDILEAVKPLLAEMECQLTLTDDIIQIGDRFYVKATTVFSNQKGDSIGTTAYAREPLDKKGSDQAQVTGMASSYARKYALNGLFLIDDNKDADYLPSKEDIDKAVAKVNAAKSVEEVTAIWNDYAILKTNETFKVAVSIRGNQLKQKNEKDNTKSK